MDSKGFIKETVCKLQPSIFNQLKESIVDSYITFSILQPYCVITDVLAEKLCDYFETLEVNTGKSFDKQIESYMNDLDDIVSPWIAKTPQTKKGDTSPTINPRTRMYYEKALHLKNSKALITRMILDYSRIMMCLYMEITRGNQHKVIDNFTYSADCINPTIIIERLKDEEKSLPFSKAKKTRFDTKDKYNSDSCTMILAIIALYTIKNETMQGEN